MGYLSTKVFSIIGGIKCANVERNVSAGQSVIVVKTVIAQLATAVQIAVADRIAPARSNLKTGHMTGFLYWKKEELWAILQKTRLA